MKKLVLLLVTLVMTLAMSAVALAAPSFYANSNFDLSGLDTVKVAEIVNNIPKGAAISALPEEKLLSALYKGASKSKINVLDVRHNDVAMTLKYSPTRVKAAYLQVVISDMSTTQRYVPGYWERRTDYEDRVWYDKYGHKHTDRVPYTRDIWIPESWHTDVHIDLLYNLYDENGTVLANSSDKRDRTDEDNPNGMLGRSAETFFKNIKKAGKK